MPSGIQSNFSIAVMVASLIASQPLIAKEKWVRIESSGAPHTSGADGRSVAAFEVLTDSGEGTGRKIVERLIQLRAALAPSGALPLPVRIILLANETEFAAYSSDPYQKGFYQSGPDLDTIVLFSQGSLTYQVLAHEFIHLLRNHQGGRLSHWLEEGIAEFYSTIEFRKGFAVAGYDVESHSRTLRNPESNSEPAQYARGWAAARAAILQVRGSLLVRIPLAPIEDRAEPATEIAEVDALVLRAGMLLEVSKHEAAAALFERIAATYPTSAAAEMGLFQLAMFESTLGSTQQIASHRTEAARHVLRAIELGAGSDAVFEYAMLLRESKAPRSEIDRWLERTLALSPRHAEAHLLLGVEASSAGNLGSALAHLQSAAAILPRHTSVWHALGYAQWKAGKLDAARQSAKSALDAAKDPAERGMAESLAQLIDQPKLDRPGTAIITPDSWKPRLEGDRRTEGKLVRVDCGANGALLHVESPQGALALAATADTRVARFVNGRPEESSSGAEIPCPLPRPLRVRVEYRRQPTGLVLAAIEFIEP